MGLIESLIKVVDPSREEERRVARDLPARETAGSPPSFICRICGHRSADGSYCPTCLAPTMERTPKER